MVSKKSGAGLAAALGAAMLLGGAGAAHAAPAEGGASLTKTDLAQALGGTTTGLGYGVAPIKDLRLDPWANSSADVLNNGATVKPENTGLAPIGTETLTGPLSAGGGPRDLPVVGQLLGALPG
ncbi:MULTISPECIES: hypothetical protein [unclassified Streptomyces]|uniref:hypothetical protein n=1 Tax=Streptomycetaceae TaxID=2062 RepID=UPI002E78CBEE|nr:MULTISPECIES: hypothetical protein [unclassified Streptomyces]MED7951604.1 hypothetical protein [Streptomyces sp. BE303]MEE1829060.1 hypothetical protein [Streptomyces sp. BE20]